MTLRLESVPLVSARPFIPSPLGMERFEITLSHPAFPLKGMRKGFVDGHDRSRALFTIDPPKKEQGYEFLNLNSIQKCTLSGGGSSGMPGKGTRRKC
jgi:hypothetical protein